MKTMFPIALAALLAGCTTPGPDTPPPHMSRVKVLMYDHTPRTMTAKLDFCNRPPTKPHKVIALITCEGAYHEEVVMMEAIHFKARQIGADGVIRADTAQATTGSGPAAGGRSLYRAEAFVYETTP